MNILENSGRSSLRMEEIIDKNVLNRVQESFCSVANIYSLIMDDKGRMLTEMTGDETDVRLLYEKLGQDAFFRVYDRVAGDSLEEQVVECTPYENVRLAAFQVRVKADFVLNWVVCAVFEPDMESKNEDDGSAQQILTGVGRYTQETRFYDTLDLMRLVANRMLATKSTLANVEAERLRTVTDNENMSGLLKRAEAMTAIVQLLGSDDAAAIVFEKLLGIVGEYLRISSAQIFVLHTDGETMDVLAEWCREGVYSFYEKTQNIKRSPLLTGERTNVISSNTMCSVEERLLMEEAHICAMVTFPLLVDGRIDLYAAFQECQRERQWSLEEIRFMNDAVQVVQSILVKRIQKNSLVSSHTSLEEILDHVGCAISVRDEENDTMLFVNKIWKATFDRQAGSSIRHKLKTAKEGEKLEFYNDADGKHYDLFATQILWVDGRRAALLAAYDITEKKRYQRKIEQLAYTDYLTGLYNRLCCERDLAVQIDAAQKAKRRGALLYLDLDDFKHINDGLGHQYGDELLKEIARSFTRIEEIRDTCYRMGGDEFVVLVPMDKYPRLTMILEKISDIFTKSWFLKNSDYYCTMSMGVITFPDEGEAVDDLISKADMAMYEAKRGGKNRIVEYTSDIESGSGKRLSMEKNMRDATMHGCTDFEIYYQPIVDISLEEHPCTGAEALLRWNSPELGFIPPSDFIPLAEYLGLINPIGNHVLREACKTLREWNDHGYPHYKMNVNLSVVQLLQNDIVESVESIVQESGINPHNLTLEVTESLAINDIERMKNILSRIKALGVRIALDDFGTGYSSLNHIKQMPLDVIKVDQTFVRDLDRDAYAQSFIKMVSELAVSLGVSVCVEGIERKEQLDVLEGMKVRMIQGYYFGRPMPKDQFMQQFASGKE
ncbi:MAG: bifunctional diguanylate cyclase/phosphodiesterase [Lachnospiraceae bacterium]|nr:bifunctional diguanylate cyclase/phosphodiesterase [Lachnospiraceae bacterium]